MTTKIMGNNGIYKNGENSSPKPVKTGTDNTHKTAQIFNKEISNAGQSSKEDEREVFIKFYMNEKGVSRDVAAAEYDFFI